MHVEPTYKTVADFQVAVDNFCTQEGIEPPKTEIDKLYENYLGLHRLVDRPLDFTYRTDNGRKTLALG